MEQYLIYIQARENAYSETLTMAQKSYVTRILQTFYSDKRSYKKADGKLELQRVLSNKKDADFPFKDAVEYYFQMKRMGKK